MQKKEVQVYRVQDTTVMCGLSEGGLVPVVVEAVDATPEQLAAIGPEEPATGTLHGPLRWEKRAFHATRLSFSGPPPLPLSSPLPLPASGALAGLPLLPPSGPPSPTHP